MGKIKELLVELNEEQLIDLVEKELNQGVSPEEILEECQKGMNEIGDLFSKGEMFVSDLMMSGNLFKQVSGELIMPHLGANTSLGDSGKVVLGTVKDDIHDIGKDIVHTVLSAAGFEVIDLGVDVPEEEFVKAVKRHDAKVVGLSCLLASCYQSILNTVEAFKAAGIRDDIKIIIGGGPVDEHVVTYSGADAYGATAQDTVNYCKEVLGNDI